MTSGPLRLKSSPLAPRAVKSPARGLSGTTSYRWTSSSRHGGARYLDQGVGLVPWKRDASHNSRAGHPVWRRCSSLTYAQYARSSRLASRAPRSGTYARHHASRGLAALEQPRTFRLRRHHHLERYLDAVHANGDPAVAPGGRPASFSLPSSSATASASCRRAAAGASRRGLPTPARMPPPFAARAAITRPVFCRAGCGRPRSSASSGTGRAATTWWWCQARWTCT